MSRLQRNSQIKRIPRTQHTIPVITLVVIVLILNLGVTSLGYYISQVAFPGGVIELQFTAYQGTTVIQTASTIWQQVWYAVAVTLSNVAIIVAIWYRSALQRVVKFVCLYWLSGMTIATLGGILYYLILVIRVNS